MNFLRVGDKFKNPFDKSVMGTGKFVGAKQTGRGTIYYFEAPNGESWWFHEDNVKWVLEHKPPYTTIQR